MEHRLDFNSYVMTNNSEKCNRRYAKCDFTPVIVFLADCRSEKSEGGGRRADDRQRRVRSRSQSLDFGFGLTSTTDQRHRRLNITRPRR